MMKTALLVSISVLLGGALFGKGGIEDGESMTSRKLPAVIVEAEWLAEQLDETDLIILDTNRPSTAYMAHHIQGAVRIPRDAYYREVDGVRGMFPGVSEMVEILREAGISNESRVVIYDQDNALWASRLFWSLEYLGHENVAVLNGGLAKWRAEGRPVQSGRGRTPKRGDFNADVQEHLLVDGSWIEANLREPSVTILDTRSPEEYSGEEVHAARGGHIPGAVLQDWVVNLTEEPGLTLFKSREALAEIYADHLKGTGRTITHCQTGVRGSHTYLVLRYLGAEDVALYDASWEEWGNQERFPVAR